MFFFYIFKYILISIDSNIKIIFLYIQIQYIVANNSLKSFSTKNFIFK